LPQTVKQSQSTPKWLSRIQQNQLLRHVERYGNVRDMVIIKVMMNTGLRVGELWVELQKRGKCELRK